MFRKESVEVFWVHLAYKYLVWVAHKRHGRFTHHLVYIYGHHFKILNGGCFRLGGRVSNHELQFLVLFFLKQICQKVGDAWLWKGKHLWRVHFPDTSNYKTNTGSLQAFLSRPVPSHVLHQGRVLHRPPVLQWCYLCHELFPGKSGASSSCQVDTFPFRGSHPPPPWRYLAQQLFLTSRKCLKLPASLSGDSVNIKSKGSGRKIKNHK